MHHLRVLLRMTMGAWRNVHWHSVRLAPQDLWWRLMLHLHLMWWDSVRWLQRRRAMGAMLLSNTRWAAAIHGRLTLRRLGVLAWREIQRHLLLGHVTSMTAEWRCVMDDLWNACIAVDADAQAAPARALEEAEIRLLSLLLRDDPGRERIIFHVAEHFLVLQHKYSQQKHASTGQLARRNVPSHAGSPQ